MKNKPTLFLYSVNNKFEKLTRHFDQMINVHVILSVEKQRQKAEATIHVSGAELFASDENENMYTAIDHLVSKLDRQVIRHKDKIKNHQQADGADMKHNAG